MLMMAHQAPKEKWHYMESIVFRSTTNAMLQIYRAFKSTTPAPNPGSCESTNKRHQQGTTYHRDEGIDPPPPMQGLVALLSQEVFRQQLHEPRKKQQAAGNSIHEAHHEQSRLAHGVVEVVHDEPDRLADRGRRPVREDHEPRPGRRLGEVQARYAGAEREALKGLVEGDRHEEHHERRARGDRYRHPDEDAVEEDAGLEEQALQHQAPLLFRIRHVRHRRAFWCRLPAVEGHAGELVHVQL